MHTGVFIGSGDPGDEAASEELEKAQCMFDELAGECGGPGSDCPSRSDADLELAEIYLDAAQNSLNEGDSANVHRYARQVQALAKEGLMTLCTQVGLGSSECELWTGSMC
jgi:hypothetical protein